MKVMVTGAKGMLGTEMMGVLKDSCDVYGMDIDEVDITDLLSVTRMVKGVSPDVVINCAAYTNVDGCESNVETAYKVNALGPRNLAVACNEAGAALVHLSTDYVFPGNGAQPYKEDDPTGPKSIYGSSKLAGENYVRTLCNRYYIVRTAWLFGIHGPNFIKTILKLSKENNSLNIVNDQVGSPTYARDLAKAISKLIFQPTYGTFHITNSGTCSWHQFTQEILKLAGLEREVNPITTKELNRPAPRPAYSVMDNFHWRLLGYEPLRHYTEALQEYMNQANETNE